MRGNISKQSMKFLSDEFMALLWEYHSIDPVGADEIGLEMSRRLRLPKTYKNRPLSDDDLIRRGDVLGELEICVSESKEVGLDYIDTAALRLRIKTMEAYKYKRQCSICVLYDDKEGRCYSDKSEHAGKLVRDTRYCDCWMPYWGYRDDTVGEEENDG